ncbi:twin-arginine translocation pathway signal [Mycobacterium interjectum]|uniref:twin-arginine translocation pathway signal n=1 Tax=Mycobacterium interjectum TaxID=33895 RepID=UPI0008299F16|nr:twin-arginine translocation pathway signal [Mycobacterium interjectum]MCV7089580.1 twin-arginine translocation pathway signal [Mycobacterium interjectum]
MTLDSAPPTEARQPAPALRAGAIGRWTRRFLARWRPILLTLVLIAALGNAARIFYFDYRPDLRTDRAAAHQVIRAASDGAVALLSYSPETLESDFANAKSRLTEDYLAYYQRFVDQVVGPSAQRGQVTTTATVVKAAVSELHPNSAVVLVFIKQKTTSKAKPEPVVTSSSLKVEMAKVKGSWLIDKFDVL